MSVKANTRKTSASKPNESGNDGQYKLHKQFIMVTCEVKESPAYRATRKYPWLVQFIDLIEIEYMHHGGKENGHLPIPRRPVPDEVQRKARRKLYSFEEWGIGRKYITPAQKIMTELGLITCVGGSGQRGGTDATNHYGLSWLPSKLGEPPTNGWKKIATFDEAETIIAKHVPWVRGVTATGTPPDALLAAEGSHLYGTGRVTSTGQKGPLGSHLYGDSILKSSITESIMPLSANAESGTQPASAGSVHEKDFEKEDCQDSDSQGRKPTGGKSIDPLTDGEDTPSPRTAGPLAQGDHAGAFIDPWEVEIRAHRERLDARLEQTNPVGRVTGVKPEEASTMRDQHEQHNDVVRSALARAEQPQSLCRQCGKTNGKVGVHNGVPLHAACVGLYEADEAERNRADENPIDF